PGAEHHRESCPSTALPGARETPGAAATRRGDVPMNTDDLPRPEDADTPDDVGALAEALHEALEREARGEPARPEDLLPAGSEGGARLADALRVADQLAEFVRHVEGESGIHIVPAGESSTQVYEAGAEGLPQPFPGEYAVRALLGEGSFGRVWLADDLNLGIPVALKTVRLQGDVERRSRALAQLENQAQKLARLKHPNVGQGQAWRQAGGGHSA